jgi:uncharacterized protein YjbI with pentapeptide repeats
LEAAPIFNTALQPSSSRRYEEIRQRAHWRQSKNLHRMKLAGGGEIHFSTPAGDERSKLLAAQAEMRRLGIKRSLVLDIKNPNADFKGMNLKGTVLTGKMPKDLTGANCEGATFYQIAGGTMAPGANFKNATFREANLEGTKARGATFDGAHMQANVDATRLDAPQSSWRGVRALGIRVTDANLSGARFQNTDFSHAEAARARLDGARGSLDLSGAHAEGISLRQAQLDLQAPNADMKLGDLMGARLNNPNFNNATLDAQVLHGARITSLSAALLPQPSQGAWAASNKQDLTRMQRQMRMAGPSPG